MSVFDVARSPVRTEELATKNSISFFEFRSKTRLEDRALAAATKTPFPTEGLLTDKKIESEIRI
jgi:hypothetical protein